MKEIKAEVRELCVQFRREKIGSEEWNRLSDVLQKKWKFTPFNLLALFGKHPTIEYNEENTGLVLEEEKLKLMNSQTIPKTNLPRAVCLVGSTHPKWKDRYREAETELTKAGYVVLSVVWFKDQLPNFEQHRDLLERIHFQKIRLADAVVLIHKDAVGKHTTMEMTFAKEIGIPVFTYTKEIMEKLKVLEK